ncbi:MAG: serine racemase VanT catalytic subunit [Lachnospiraceae bacterium]|nr:serine racemase VanT catalytic subunit [Lachnospiraceae bacterium]
MKSASFKTERAWLEIKIENLRHNVETLKKVMQPGCELMAVVKAQAYGHGAVLTASYLNKLGVMAFAVATIEEGITLRKSGVCGEILILGYTDVRRASELKEYDLMQTLISFEYAENLNEQGIDLKTHIKIDTGMHRLGISDKEVSAVRNIFFMKNLKVCGMYTHLCCSDSRHSDDAAFTQGQINSFYRLADALKDSGIILPKLHIQSSYGLLNYPGLACDYVRIGIALYGVLSSREDETVLNPDLRPVLSLKSRVVLIREVAAGESVGYGRSFITGRDTRIAILPVGYGDGFPRNLSNGKGSVLINGYIVPIVGRICMDQFAVDITDTENISVGDIATLVGAKEYDELSAPAVADSSDSISNELLCRMGARLPVIVR